jgi:endoglucanase
MKRIFERAMAVAVAGLIAASFSCSSSGKRGGEAGELAYDGNIHVNQIGYAPSSRKAASIEGATGPFQVLEASSGKIVLEGNTSAAVKDPLSGSDVSVADFSALSEPGTYVVALPGKGKSAPFAVLDDPYRAAQDAMVKFLYYQRSGIDIDEAHGGKWTWAKGHTEPASLWGNEKTEIDVSGGWYDAGDYGRYAVPAATTIGNILMALDLFPQAFGDSLGIPESGDGLPDALNEARWAAEWLLKMQDSKTGMVYHKVTTAGFPGMNLSPENDTSALFVLPPSITATMDAAAALAGISRSYAVADPRFSATCLAAAKAAFDAASGAEDKRGFKNPPGVSTGEYGDSNDSDERFWAAVALYRATGEKRYIEYAAAKPAFGFSFGWGSVGGFALHEILIMGEGKADLAGLRKEALERLGQVAAAAAAQAAKSPWGAWLTARDFIWGSNMEVSHRATVFVLEERYLGKDRSAEIQAHWDYLFGRNSLDRSYVTGFGANPPEAPHHRISVSDGVDEPVPGMLAGGPNMGLQDPDLARSRKGAPPMDCYVDVLGSYASNEVTTYWNASAYPVSARLSSGRP